MDTETFGTPDRSSWEVAFEYDPVSRRSGRTRRAAGQTDHGYIDDRKAPDLRGRTPPRDRGHRRQVPTRLISIMRARSAVALDEVAEIVGQRHAIDVAARPNLTGDIGRDVLHPVLERVEGDDLDGVVEAAGDEFANRGVEIASLDTDFGRLVEAVDHHEQGLVCAIGHDRGWHAGFKHLRHSRLRFRSPSTGKTGRRFLRSAGASVRIREILSAARAP